MTTEPPSSSSETKSSLPQIPDLPDVLTKRYEQSRPDAETEPTEAVNATQPIGEEPGSGETTRRWATRLYGAVREKGCIGNALGGLFILIVLVAAIFYALGGQPLFPINGPSPSLIQHPTNSGPQATVAPTPTFIILGQFGGEVFTYNSSVDKIYGYSFDVNNRQEREIIRVPEFEKFLWHAPAKLLLISRAENALGNIYLYNLTQPHSEPELPTRREDAPNFPPNLRVDSASELAWSQDGDLIAFTARDIESDKETLFIYAPGHPQLIYTPARAMDSISSLLWITNTLTTTTGILSFVAISDGQEDRYFVDRSGGGFTKWMVK
jgi:hypothetical protein